ncbi:hypothetical protein F53441_14144 [Fusarium austroafricanum]|uniref:Uncharacterized protein n=1 Tax=Fusarium austroafricanum TaxID=2364996 RepID=A0A8H4JJ44_9HYPO|nr:hypothetical protein F53441_14144 [Fusarium austroafricanum]
MHRRFKTWIDSKRQRKTKAESSSVAEPEMPFLPNPRPYALTPSVNQNIGSGGVVYVIAWDPKASLKTTCLGWYSPAMIRAAWALAKCLEYTLALGGGSAPIHAGLGPWDGLWLADRRLIVPQRLSAIISLEVVWSIGTHKHRCKAAPNQKDVDEVLHILDTHFTNLISLHLGLQLDLRTLRWVEGQTVIRRQTAYLDMFQILDAFVQSRTDGRQDIVQFRDPFTLSITTYAFTNICEEIEDRDGNHQQVKDLGVKVWRRLVPGMQEPEEWGKGESATADSGYWIWPDRENARDCDKMSMTVQTCFGS